MSLWLAIGGVLCLSASVVAAHSSWQFDRRAKAALGKVVRSHREHDGVSNATYAAVIEYAGVDGKMVEFTPSMRSALEPVIGEPVRILYDPANPSDVRIGPRWRLYTVAAVILFAGAGLAAAALLRCF